MTNRISSKRFALIIPTLNAESWAASILSAVAQQDIHPDLKLVIDSSSTDRTEAIFREAGWRVYTIERKDFDHGDTRQLGAVLMGDIDVLVYMTQDAILASPSSLSNLIRVFDDPSVAVAYGRQLPRLNAGPIEAHARHFNYRVDSSIVSKDAAVAKGLRGAFCSNSFAAYRSDVLRSVGGFPSKCVFGEDMLVAIDILDAGWLKAYVADAVCYHSHSYTWKQEFRRSFDIGAMHSIESPRLSPYQTTGTEGGRFVRSELAFLLRKAPQMIPDAILRTSFKAFGYYLGRQHDRLPNSVKRSLSMNGSYWAVKTRARVNA